MTWAKQKYQVFYGLGIIAFVTLSACAENGKTLILKKETQRCEAQLSAVINPNLYESIDPQGVNERAMILAMHQRMEPSRRETTGDNIRLIVTKYSCHAYDRTGNILGEYSMALSTDTLSWWIRNDMKNGLVMTEMVQDFDKKGTPLKAKPRLHYALKTEQQEIEETSYSRTGKETRQLLASYDYDPESRIFKMTTKNKILEFTDDGQLTRSVYCYEFGGPYCQDSATWDVHNFEYNESGLVITEHGFAEGKSGQNENYHYKRDFELNDRGHVIREASKFFDGEKTDWQWGEERRILYYD